MKPKATFTKKDALVILGCGVFLLANLGAIGGGARRRAKEMVCLSNLHQWGIVFQRYLDDNEGKFSGGEETEDGFVEHIWVLYLQPYFETFDIMLCPTTTKTWCDGVFEGAFVAWDFRCRDELYLPDEWYEYYGDSYGSYGKNSWCSQWEHGADPTDGGWNWKNIYSVRDGHRVPLLLDAMFLGGFPLHEDEPPAFDGQTFWSGGWGEMNRYCMNRHNGYINGLFLDWSARKIGLKELWTLKWHREFYINGPWTIAGFAGNEHACAAAWDNAAPWMRDFPEY